MMALSAPVFSFNLDIGLDKKGLTEFHLKNNGPLVSLIHYKNYTGNEDHLNFFNLNFGMELEFDLNKDAAKNPFAFKSPTFSFLTTNHRNLEDFPEGLLMVHFLAARYEIIKVPNVYESSGVNVTLLGLNYETPIIGEVGDNIMGSVCAGGSVGAKLGELTLGDVPQGDKFQPFFTVSACMGLYIGKQFRIENQVSKTTLLGERYNDDKTNHDPYDVYSGLEEWENRFYVGIFNKGRAGLFWSYKESQAMNSDRQNHALSQHIFGVSVR